jgi:hypothetical protein
MVKIVPSLRMAKIRISMIELQAAMFAHVASYHEGWKIEFESKDEHREGHQNSNGDRTSVNGIVSHALKDLS